MEYKILLNELLTALKTSKKRFSERLGLSQGNVSDWFNRPGYRPSIDALKRISETFNVNLNWLVTGEGPMFIEKSRRGVRLARDLLRLPVVADIAAGAGIEAFDIEPEEYLALHPSIMPAPGPYFAFRVQGESMTPHIQNGDYAIVTTSWQEMDINDQICAVRTHEGLTLKRYIIDSSRRMAVLYPLNPVYPTIRIEEDDPDYVIVGVLLLIIRKYLR